MRAVVIGRLKLQDLFTPSPPDRVVLVTQPPRSETRLSKLRQKAILSSLTLAAHLPRSRSRLIHQGATALCRFQRRRARPSLNERDPTAGQQCQDGPQMRVRAPLLEGPTTNLRAARTKGPPFSHVLRLEYTEQPTQDRMARETKRAGPVTKAQRKTKVLGEEASSLALATVVRVMWVVAKMHVTRRWKSRRLGGSG